MITFLKTFASFMLVTFALSLGVRCFFAHAEIRFGSEPSGVPCGAQLQTLADLALMISSVCFLVLSSFYVFLVILVYAGVAALEMMRFCARTVAEAALLATKGLCPTNRLFRHCAAGCFVLLLVAIDSCLPGIAEDATRAGYMDLLGPGSFKMLVCVATVLQATARSSLEHVGSKRDQRVAFRVSFIFIVHLAINGVACTLGGGHWVCLGAVLWFWVTAELRRPSAATKTAPPSRLELLETSSPLSFNATGPLRETEDTGVTLDAYFRDFERKYGLRRVRFPSEEKLVSYRFVKHLQDMGDNEKRELFDTRWMSKDFTEMKTDEVIWECQFEREFFDGQGPAPVMTEEMFFVDEKGELCHPAHWITFSTELVPFIRESGVVPAGFASWDAYEGHLRQYQEFYVHHFCCGPTVEPSAHMDDGGTLDVDCDGHEEEDRDGSMVVVEMVPDVEADTAVETKADQEVVEVAAPVPVPVHVPVPGPSKRKKKTFGPCNRTRPYLMRECKANVRYSK
jgi:hypothetical protein